MGCKRDREREMNQESKVESQMVRVWERETGKRREEVKGKRDIVQDRYILLLTGNKKVTPKQTRRMDE